MVVTRRAPAPPVPTSRTNSAQVIPRVKGRPQGVHETSSPLANGAAKEDGPKDVAALDESSSKKAKGKWKNKAKKEKRKKDGSALIELLTRIFLLWFTIYTISVCPNDDSLESPICRGLSAYRRYVLDPYVIPQVQRALAHPSVAPYVNRATPVIQNTIDTAKPVVIRAQSEWNHRIVPQWKKRVVPQWQKHVDPQLDKYVWPHFTNAKGLLVPYVSTAEAEYERRLGPQVRFVLHKLHTWQYQARPYVILAAHKTYDGYQMAKPYAIPVLEQLQTLFWRLMQLLQEQRRQFVDPHVQKIWERVKELSGETKPIVTVPNTFTASVSKASATASSFLSSVLETSSTLVPTVSEAAVASASAILPDVVSETESLPSPFPSTNPTAAIAASESIIAPIQTASSLISSISEEVVTAVTSAAAVTDVIGSSASSFASIGSSAIFDEAVPSASSLVHESIITPAASFSQQASASVASVSDVAATAVEAAAFKAFSVASSVTDQVTQTAASVVSSVIPSQSSDDNETDDLDLDDFYAELGLNDIDAGLTDAPEQVSEPETRPQERPLSEEEKAAIAEQKLRLKEQTAIKRRDIMDRHARWEAKLKESISNARKELRKNLVASRKVAAAELKQSRAIRGEIDGLVEDAEKYLKGAEKYLSGMLKDSRNGRSNEEKQTMWERVVEKVDKKFEERLSQTEAVVNGWYDQVVNAEIAEIYRLRDGLKAISDDAQGDLGLEYAWLDDVTYLDWQRYHDLERVVNNFTAAALTIQDGSHPSPPINPITPVIDDLQNEVQDVIVGFETRLRRMKRKGERGFGAVLDDSGEDDVPADETVSILPIEEEAQEQQGESPAVPPVVIGRSKEEIASVLDRIAEQEAQATSAPDAKDVDPEQVVMSLAQEVAEEGNFASSPAQHDEL